MRIFNVSVEPATATSSKRTTNYVWGISLAIWRSSASTALTLHAWNAHWRYTVYSSPEIAAGFGHSQPGTIARGVGKHPTASVVSAWRGLVLQLTRTRGLPNATQVVQDIAICGLGCGLENPSLFYPGRNNFLIIYYSNSAPGRTFGESNPTARRPLPTRVYKSQVVIRNLDGKAPG